MNWAAHSSLSSSCVRIQLQCGQMLQASSSMISPSLYYCNLVLGARKIHSLSYLKKNHLIYLLVCLRAHISGSCLTDFVLPGYFPRTFHIFQRHINNLFSFLVQIPLWAWALSWPLNLNCSPPSSTLPPPPQLHCLAVISYSVYSFFCNK